MSRIVTLDLTGWRPALTTATQQKAVRALEDGGVLVLPHVSFVLLPSERQFLSTEWSDSRAKNISLDGGVLKGARGSSNDRDSLAAMITRFASLASQLVTTLFPRYAPYVKQARTSYRPQPAVGRELSWRKDDSRLHIDAFPSRPNHGQRILRVFSNVNPREDRVWRVGEPFEAMAKNMLDRVPRHRPLVARALAMLSVTRGVRSEYDHLMLSLHDSAKADLQYQRNCLQQRVQFAPGTTWLCFSDQVMHAAVSGQYMLEQTIHLPISALYDAARSPLAILERITGRALVSSR